MSLQWDQTDVKIPIKVSPDLLRPEVTSLRLKMDAEVPSEVPGETIEIGDRSWGPHRDSGPPPIFSTGISDGDNTETELNWRRENNLLLFFIQNIFD